MTSLSDHFHDSSDEDDELLTVPGPVGRDESCDNNDSDRASSLSYIFQEDEIASQDTFSITGGTIDDDKVKDDISTPEDDKSSMTGETIDYDKAAMVTDYTSPHDDNKLSMTNKTISDGKDATVRDNGGIQLGMPIQSTNNTLEDVVDSSGVQALVAHPDESRERKFAGRLYREVYNRGVKQRDLEIMLPLSAATGNLLNSADKLELVLELRKFGTNKKEVKYTNDDEESVTFTPEIRNAKYHKEDKILSIYIRRRGSNGDKDSSTLPLTKSQDKSLLEFICYIGNTGQTFITRPVDIRARQGAPKPADKHEAPKPAGKRASSSRTEGQSSTKKRKVTKKQKQRQSSVKKEPTRSKSFKHPATVKNSMY